jgi:hypothetical protein
MESYNTVRVSNEDLPRKALNFGEISEHNRVKKKP